MRKYERSDCMLCGKHNSWISESWLVPDGEDDVDWDFDEWCLNKECPSNNYKLNKKMNNEYPKTKATTFDIETKTLLATVEFSSCGIFIIMKRNDEDEEQRINITLQSSEELNDFNEIVKKINSLNLGE